MTGSLKYDDTFRIDGRFSGTIETEGTLVVGSDAEVDADIRAAVVSVAGTVSGSIEASQRIELFAGGRLECDVVTPSIRIEDGGHFIGRCETRPLAAPGASPQALDMSLVAHKLNH